MCQFSCKSGNLYFFGPNMSKNEFCGRNTENISAHSESALPRYHACGVSDKTVNFEFSSLHLWKLPNYVQYFGSYNVEGVAEIWVEAEMNWVEVDGATWRWMEVYARFSSFNYVMRYMHQFECNSYFLTVKLVGMCICSI